RRGAVKRASLALLASWVVALALGEWPEPTSIRITTWNLEWFPNGSAHDATPEVQAQRIAAAADVLRPINPDIILLQEVRDYEACARLGEAIAPGMYHVAICSAFKEPFQSGLGKQQVAILSKYQAQAAWAEPWKSMNGVDPPRGFALAWFKIGSQDIGVYSVHLKSNLITRGNREAKTAKNRGGWQLPKRPGGRPGRTLSASSLHPVAEALVKTHKELETKTKTGLMQTAAKAAEHAAEKPPLDVSNTSQLRDLAQSAARIFGWDSDKPGVQLNQQFVITPEQLEQIRRLRAVPEPEQLQDGSTRS